MGTLGIGSHKKLFHGEIKVGVAKGFMFQGKMPPFLFIGFKFVFDHQGSEEHAVGSLFREDGLALGSGDRTEKIKSRSHIQFPGIITRGTGGKGNYG